MKIVLSLVLMSLFIAGCDKNDDNMPKGSTDILYFQTNDFGENKNAILAYQDKGDGNLVALPGSPFLTKGAGVSNPMQKLGPLDSDYELRMSSDGKYLMAVNSGSNTIAVFSVGADGSLSHVAGSPFPSGGQTPVSIDVSGNYVFVVNKNDDPLHPSALLPNYTTFTIDGAGKLTPVAGAKFETTAGTSPSFNLVSRDGKFVFGADFLSFMVGPQVGSLRSFTVGSGGILSPATGTPIVLPNGAMPPDNGALGLWQHPSGNPLYVGLPLQGKVGVFNIDAATGALTMQSTVGAGAAACWIRTNKAGDHMYVLNSGDNTVQFYNTSTPVAPASVQVLPLKNSGPSYTLPNGAMLKTSEDFSLALSPSEKTLYVVCQHTNVDFSIGNYNYLHILKIGSDGKLTEDGEPMQIPVPNTVRPKGSVVISR